MDMDGDVTHFTDYYFVLLARLLTFVTCFAIRTFPTSFNLDLPKVIRVYFLDQTCIQRRIMTLVVIPLFTFRTLQYIKFSK